LSVELAIDCFDRSDLGGDDVETFTDRINTLLSSSAATLEALRVCACSSPRASGPE
jgi:hypothetical protein